MDSCQKFCPYSILYTQLAHDSALFWQVEQFITVTGAVVAPYTLFLSAVSSSPFIFIFYVVTWDYNVHPISKISYFNLHVV